MHLLRKQKKKGKKYVLQIQKNMHKKSLAVRAGSVRPRGLAGRIKPPKRVRRFTVARFEYVPKPEQNLLQGGFHCCRMVQTAASRPTKPKERRKKGKKEG